VGIVHARFAQTPVGLRDPPGSRRSAPLGGPPSRANRHDRPKSAQGDYGANGEHLCPVASVSEPAVGQFVGHLDSSQAGADLTRSGLSARRCEYSHAFLRVALAQAVEDHQVPANVACSVQPPRQSTGASLR
jgi:hypothetical protein